MQLRLVHCADLHIGAPFSYLCTEKAKERKDELCKAFSDIIDFCKEKAVDALLICGDLFDCPVPAKRDSEFVRSLLASLSPTPVYIVCGNHDYLCGESPFIKENFFTENVHIFPSFDYAFELSEKNAVFFGKSFSNNVTTPSFENITTDPDKINVLCLHGDTVTGSDYNSISKEALAALNCEYAAFGHIHTREYFLAGKVKCAYSGTAEAQSFSDGNDCGFIYAQITKENTTLTHIDSSKRRYHNIDVDVSGLTESEIISEIKKVINSNDLFRVTLTGEKSESFNINLDFIQKKLSSSVFFIEFSDNTTFSYNFDEIESESSLRGEFLRELRKSCSGEEEFIICAKVGLDALSGNIPSLEVPYAD